MPRSAQAAGDAAEISADKPTPTACFICFPSCKAVAQGTGHGPFHIYGRDSGQPCPAQNYRPVQVDDKMKTPPELSLRGAKRRGNLGKALPNCTGHCRGADSRARRNAADSNGPPLKWQRLPDLSLRGGRRPTWQSREGSYVFAGSTQLSGQVLRDFPVASLLGMAILIALRRRITTAIRATAVGAH